MWDFITYTLNEQRGTAFLLLLCFATLVLRYWPWTNTTTVEFLYAQDDSLNTYTPVLQKPRSRLKRGWDLTTFDINYAKAKDLRRMGFSNQFIGQWFSIKQKVGFVTSHDQFCDLNLLSDAELKRVSPFLDFSRYAAKTKIAKRKDDTIPVMLDINLADSSEFKRLPGIGKTLSKRIVKYRDALGGFYKIDQLGEVYGITDSLVLRLKPQLEMTGGVHQITVNQTDFKTLKKHPYINHKQANAIVRYRQMHGKFANMQELGKVHVLDSARLLRIKPYLSFD